MWQLVDNIAAFHPTTAIVLDPVAVAAGPYRVSKFIIYTESKYECFNGQTCNNTFWTSSVLLSMSVSRYMKIQSDSLIQIHHLFHIQDFYIIIVFFFFYYFTLKFSQSK